MVNGIDANNALTQVPQQVYTTAPQQVVTAGAQAAEQLPDTFLSTTKNAASSVGLFEGIPLLNLFVRSKKSTGKTLSQGMNLIGLHNKTALKKLLHGEGKLSKRILDFVSSANKSKQAYMAERSSVKALNKSVKATKKLEKITKKLSQAAENNAGKLKKGILNFSKKHIKGKAAKAEAKAVEMASRAETARTVINTTQAAGKLGKVRNILKSSGAGIMLVCSGIAECFSEVVPTFKELGAKKGFKQIGKSSVKVLGDTVGFIGGEQAGVALGTAIGTAICPGIGSAVGAVCGLVGGFLGSWVMGKVTKAITGKTEREIAKEQEQQEVQKNPFEEFEQYQLNPYSA